MKKRRSSLSARLISGLLVTVILLSSAFFLYLYPLFTNTIDELVKSRAKSHVELGYEVVANYYDLSLKGKISESDGKILAIETLRNMKYQGDGYFWVNDYNHILLMHPYTPELEGKDVKIFKDPYGVYLFQEFVKVAKTQKEGFVYYSWKRPTGKEALPKISYVKGFEPWNMIIGNGAYIDDINLVKNQIFISIIAAFVILLGFILGIMYYLSNRKQVEKILIENEMKLRTTLDSIGDAVIATDINGTITRMNPAAEKLTGWFKEHAYRKPLTQVFSIVNSQTNEKIDNPVQKVIETGKTVGLANHTLLISKDGKKYHISDTAAPIFDVNNKINGVVLVFSDVTVKYLDEQRLRENEERFKVFFSMASEGMLIHDKGIILDANLAFVQMIGAGSIEEVIGAYGIELVPFTDESRKIVLEALLSGKTDIIDVEFIMPDGQKKYVETKGLEINYKSGKARLVYFKDITNRKQIENEILMLNNELECKVNERTIDLHKAMDNYMNIFIKSPVGIFRTSIEGKILMANPKLIEMLGFSSFEEFQMKNIQKDIYINDEDRINYIQQINNHGFANNFETKLYKNDKSEIFVSINANVVRDIDGNVLYYEGTIIDITEKKLQESENFKLSKMVENSPTSIVVTDVNGNIEYVNKMFLNITGYNFVEVLGKNPRILKSGKTSEHIYRDMWKTIKNGGIWRGEFINRKKNGVEFVEKATIASIVNDKNVIVNYVAIMEDISELRKTEMLMLELNNKQQILINNLPAGIYYKDINLKYQLVNQKFSKLVGLPIAVMLGKTDHELGLGAEYEEMEYQMINNELFEKSFEKQIITLRGDLIWTHTSKVLYRDYEDNVQGIIGIVSDITEKKQSEDEIYALNKSLVLFNQELELTLQQRNSLVNELTIINNELDISQKQLAELNQNLEAKVLERTRELEQSMIDLKIAKEKAEESNILKSAFISNITHEIRTPLNEIIGYSKFIAMPDLETEERDECLNSISQSSHRLIELINNILEVSLIETGQTKARLSMFNLNDLLDILHYKFYNYAIPKNLTFKFEAGVDASESNIISDEYKISKIFEVLINNSLKFTEKGFVKFGYNFIDNQIIFFVKDSGIGISDDKINLIFGLFNQSETKLSRSYEGAGIGLSLARGLVELLNGKIWAESKVDEGSTFYFSIPYLKDEINN